MSLFDPQPNLIWYVDTPDDSDQYSAGLRQMFPGQRVARFGNYWGARDAFDQSSERAELPWLVVADRVGVTSDGTNPSLAEVFQANSPLSLFFLFSSSAFSTGFPVEQWKRLRLLAEACDKSDESRMLQVTSGYARNWAREAVVRFRDYLLHESSDPTLKYFPSDDSEDYLSLIDLHSEMVRGTRLGKEQELVWEKVLLGDLSVFK